MVTAKSLQSLQSNVRTRLNERILTLVTKKRINQDQPWRNNAVTFRALLPGHGVPCFLSTRPLGGDDQRMAQQFRILMVNAGFE